MAKKPQPQAARQAADPAATAPQDQATAGATAPAAETSDDGAASAADGVGVADAQPQPITSSADSVSTSAGGEAASSGAASDDTPSERQQPDPAAPAEEAAASSEAAAGGEATFLFQGTDPEPELVLGLPPMVEILSGHMPRAFVFNAARGALDLQDEDDDAAWLALPEGKRQAAVAIALAAMRLSAQASAEIRALFEPAPEGMVEITAKSTDGQPFTRGGIRWGDSFRTETVKQEVYDRLVVDPHLTVKG